jgi:DNA sulfur modification protein DndE
MKPPVETVRVSQRSREILIKLKRKTGIENWNVLCRWAFCSSLANPSKPNRIAAVPESNIEMSWKVFAGDMGDVLSALLRSRAVQDNVAVDGESLAVCFKTHLERGISQIQNTTDLTNVVEKILLNSREGGKAG